LRCSWVEKIDLIEKMDKVATHSQYSTFKDKVWAALRAQGLILAFAALKFLLHYLLYHPVYELHRDEYLYLDQANHLAWGFLEVPPAQSIQAWLTMMLGNSFFWVKFWPVGWGTLTVWITGRIVMRLGGGLFAQALACLSVIVSGYLRLNLLFQPNSLEVLLWTTYFYLIVRYLQTERPRYILWLGFLFGIGLLNKYSAGFFMMATLVGLLLTPHCRVLLTKPFYLAIGIALLLFLPNLLWQFRHDIPFLTHMRLLNQYQLQHVKTSEFLLDQLVMCLPAAFVWLTGLVGLLSVRWLSKYRIVGLIYLAVILMLIALRGKNYYAIGLYPVLFAFGGVIWERITQQRWLFRLRPILLLVPVGLLLPFLPLAYPIWSPEKTEKFARNFQGTGVLRWEDGQDHPLPQDYADMLGWQELTQKVAAAYQQIPAGEREQTAIICSNYGEAGAINYYGRPYGLPRAQSSEASYLAWISEPVRIRNIILVDDEPDPIAQHFQYYRETGRVENPYAREKGVQIILALGADEAINALYRQEVREKKKEFRF
jgi:hypothetical protein